MTDAELVVLWRNAAMSLWQAFLDEPWSEDPKHRAGQEAAVSAYNRAVTADPAVHREGMR